MELNDYISNRLVHEIHTSGRKSFRACRRRWSWIFNDRWYPEMTPKPLEFGTAFHAGMEVYYDPAMWDWDRQVVGALAIKRFVDECEKQRRKSLEAKNTNYLEADLQEDYDERLALGRGMFEYYFKDVAPKLDKGWKPVKVEVEFMLPIPNPETGESIIWCKCDHCWDRWSAQRADDVREAWQGLPVVYAGRLDMLAEDENGNYWIFDWKTARSIAERYEFLYLDDQIASYVWALRKLGLNVRGFVYHEQRKAFPEAPNKNKVRRLGRIFSVSKSQSTDYESFLKAIKEEDAEAWQKGLYDEYLEFLRNEGTVFYARHQIHKSDEECQQTEVNIGYEALDMIDPGLRIYPSPGRFGCGFCAFQEPCKEQNANGDFMFVLESLFVRKEHYYLREQPSTESQGAQ